MTHMTKTLSILSLGLALALGACGGGGGNSCDALAKKLCAGKDDATCKKTKAWLDSEMTGPNDEKLSSAESGAACKMIMDDKAALQAYTDQANEKVK
jgi:hypothetical protein